MRRMGFPAGVWWKAAAGMVLLHVATRPLNPPGKNVNFATGVWRGLEPWFFTHPAFLLAVLGVCAVAFALLERALRRPAKPEGPAAQEL